MRIFIFFFLCGVMAHRLVETNNRPDICYVISVRHTDPTSTDIDLDQVLDETVTGEQYNKIQIRTKKKSR